ncbi:YceI family protein [Corynebacterium tapiri]|uniref:YceI family protein n=1 Tax=Corynebacterium tapiri TaxID=1448266 RepID=A0A5C4U3H3_9CORY|nr:YceI family protein [Corynebacterium tapiri]TNL97628.1 YceI family protein [Corynebacterium tapiri]
MKKALESLNPKVVISVFVVLIVGLVAAAIGPVIFALALGPGVKTEPLDATKAHEASTELNGTWEVARGSHPNFTSVGFTFEELLPSDARRTSGSTQDVSGEILVENDTLTAGEVTVDMNTITTDKNVRDVNVRNKLFESEKYPESRFRVTKPVDLSTVPTDGKPGMVELTGELTIKGHTEPVIGEFQVLRDGDKLIVSGDLLVDRNSFGVESPEMIAAKIADEGEVNILLSFEKES